MGEINDIVCQYLGTAEYYADFWNGSIFGGKKKIVSTHLVRYDREYYKNSKKKHSSIRRDVLMRNKETKDIILGVEIMETIDYTIPVRIMDYDTQEMKRQLQDIARRNKQLAKDKCLEWNNSGEFLYGVRKNDKITPVHTIALYCGTEEFDGAEDIIELTDVEGMDEAYKNLINNYPIHIISLKDLKENNFETSLREIIAIFKRSRDREAVKAYYLENKERFKQLDELSINTLGALIGKKNLNFYKQEEGGLDMCKAFEDEREEGRTEGRIEGRIEGRTEGLEIGRQNGESKMASLFQKLLILNRLDDCKKVAEDVTYRQQLFHEFGLN